MVIESNQLSKINNDDGKVTKMNRKDDSKVFSPEAINEKFAAAFNSGNIGNLLSLYEENAVLIARNGALRTGFEEIRAELLALLELGGKFTSVNRYAFRAGETALLRANWKLETASPQGEPFEIAGDSAEIIRRQPDGSWLYILDHPFGAG